jgi:hypothetical protein
MTWIEDEDWQRRLALRERCEYPREPITDPLGPHWVPTYVPARTMPQNVYSLARSVFGKTMAEWALLLAEDVVKAMPDATTGRDAPEWAAAILRCAAVKLEMFEDPAMWEHIQGDIYDMTNVPPDTARERRKHLRRRGLTVPRDEPPWFTEVDDSGEASPTVGDSR